MISNYFESPLVTPQSCIAPRLSRVLPSMAILSSVVMPLLHTGRRRTKQDRAYNGPPRQGPVRHISPAQLNLERVYEQNRLIVQKKDASNPLEPAPGPAAKGKPRLLLMGQRRYEKNLCKL